MNKLGFGDLKFDGDEGKEDEVRQGVFASMLMPISIPIFIPMSVFMPISISIPKSKSITLSTPLLKPMNDEIVGTLLDDLLW